MVILRIKKLCFNRMYDQWRGEPFLCEELDNNCLCIRVLGIEYDEAIIDSINAIFKDLNKIEYIIKGELDFNQKTAVFKLPISIFDNDGLYEVKFSVLYKDEKIRELPIQTFEIFKDRKLNNHLIERNWKLPDYTIRREREL